MIEDARRQWAPPTDPVFQIVPPACEHHISSLYTQLGSPTVNFQSFWEVYNLLRDAVDSDFLFNKATGDTFGKDASDKSYGDLGDLPLHHLRPCEFGANGVPAVQTIRDEGQNTLIDSEEEIEFLVDFSDDDRDEIF